MMFKPELAAAVMDGRKTVTRRACSSNERSPWYRERCRYGEGCSVAIQPGRGKPRIGMAIVGAVTRELFHPIDITEDEAIAEGFRAERITDDIVVPAAEAFREAWEVLHGDLEPIEVWRIELGSPHDRVAVGQEQAHG